MQKRDLQKVPNFASKRGITPMNDWMTSPAIWWLAAAVLLLAGLVVQWLIAGRERYPYQAKPLLTRREYQFYKILRRVAWQHQCIVCPKVGLKDLLSVNTRKDYMKYFNRISQKHVDFVVCDYQLQVLFALELDDSTHNTPHARRKDEFKNRAFRAAGIPLKRVDHISQEEVERLFEDL